MTQSNYLPPAHPLSPFTVACRRNHLHQAPQTVTLQTKVQGDFSVFVGVFPWVLTLVLFLFLLELVANILFYFF